MKNITINQQISMRFGLNLSESFVLGYLISRSEFYNWFSYSLMAIDIPLISTKKDTLYRIIKGLSEKGAISTIKNNDHEIYFSINFN